MNGDATEFQIRDLFHQIKRLGVKRVLIVEDPESPDGYEMAEACKFTGGAWVTVDLDVTATLARLRQLPDNCGNREFWLNVVDSDWCAVMEQNKGIG